MAEVLFYHLETRDLDAVLPQLLEKTIERGWRAVVEAGSPERIAALDAHLWTWREDSFLPHGRAGAEHAGRQPIVLVSDGSNPNGAQVRFYVDRAVPQDAAGYERVVYMFSGRDPDAVAEARAAWTRLREANEVTYWQQETSGRWVRKG